MTQPPLPLSTEDEADLTRQHNATRHQYVFLDPCGCPVGVLEGSTVDQAEDAWGEFTDGDQRREQALRARGVTMVHVSHAEYSRIFYALMLARCPHRAGKATP